MEDERIEQRPESTPWRRAMGYIFGGLIMATFTLDFHGLNFIISALGQMELLLGLRALRQENRAFRIWWRVLLVQTGLWAFHLLRMAAPGWQDFDQSAAGYALAGVGVALELVQYFCLWQGLRSVRRSAGLEPKSGGGLVLLVWYAAVVLMAISGLTEVGWPVIIITFVGYLCAIQSLSKRAREAEKAGYVLEPPPVRMPDWALGGAILGAALLGVVAVSVICDRLPMDWRPVDPAEQGTAAELRAELLALGFPEEVLADLSAEDLRACEGPLRVVSDVDTYSMSHSYNDETPKPLTVTGVAVELAGDGERWRIFHHFRWEDGTTFFGTEAMMFWPAYRDDGWSRAGEASGRVLCQRGGEEVWSPYCLLEEETVTYDSTFFGQHTSTDLYATFCFPRLGKHCRGYVTYETAEVEDGWIMSSWVNYAHARKPFRYPAITAQEWIETKKISTDDPFCYVQDALQFYPLTVEEEGTSAI